MMASNDGLNRREFLGAIAMLPAGVSSVTSSQGQGTPLSTAQVPIIDTHIHLFDSARPGGAQWPSPDDPFPGPQSLPPRFRQLAAPFGVVGAVVVEASSLVEDNQWVLDLASTEPMIVGLVGRIEPGQPEFAKNLEHFHQNRLFLGIRARPESTDDLQRLAAAGLTLDVNTLTTPQSPANPTNGVLKAVIRLTDRVPTLRVVIDHLPRYQPPPERANGYIADLQELAQRPQVYVKVSGVLSGDKLADTVRQDRLVFQERIDQMWSIFGEDRLIFASDFPNSEREGPYAAIISVLRQYFTRKGVAVAEKVFWRNSSKAYRWIRRDASQPEV